MLSQKFTVKEIVKILKGKFVPRLVADVAINDIIIDSRRLFKAENTIFFALKSKRNDGHKYIGELYQNGLRNFVISNTNFDISNFPEANFILTENTLTALQTLAATYRSRFTIPVVGITGSNGKTIIKEWLYQLISPDRRVVRSPKSYNSQVGVPLSVWQMDADYELAIFEAGISEPQEMLNLQRIIRPTIGIFTNIGEAHNENFINHQQKVGEKLKLFTKVKTLIYCPDHKPIQEVIIRSEILEGIEAFTWSRQQEATLRITEVSHPQKQQSRISGIYSDTNISINIPFTDEASIENAIHCWSLMILLGYDQTTINQRMHTLSPIAMRLELIEGINN
ncbi:MAG: bifunctional UDP-N-acetylmuramoyl-tripeptide:D-alanyl-D-alanine ligase/alanine racemase, partial [Clostridia bacterium]|nr:bifunctional UDP-N-acetylmuramoyl-tripeptide:D-alanyl-D-alanine ligase/alanine racemase [Clostridia bacterium]